MIHMPLLCPWANLLISDLTGSLFSVSGILLVWSLQCKILESSPLCHSFHLQVPSRGLTITERLVDQTLQDAIYEPSSCPWVRHLIPGWSMATDPVKHDDIAWMKWHWHLLVFSWPCNILVTIHNFRPPYQPWRFFHSLSYSPSILSDKGTQGCRSLSWCLWVEAGKTGVDVGNK